MEQLIDPFGRPVKSLRVSLTQRCNFNCFFCHREGEHDPRGELSADEVEELVSIAADLGIRRVKLTGGEPLMRDDVVEIVSRISPLVDEVSMTTNASLLAGLACELKEAGLRRVNVSFHSSDPRCFQKITRNGSMDDVKKGVEAALGCGLSPVKLNMVVMKDLNSNEVSDMIKLSRELGSILQLIEYQPLERGERDFHRYYYDMKPLEEELAASSERVIVREMQRRRQYHLNGGGIVEVVRPMHNSEFCINCTRLRLTSDGRLKPCLMRDDNLVDAVSLVREGRDKESVIEAFRRATRLREPYWGIE